MNFEIGEGGHMLFKLKNKLTYVDSAGNVVKDVDDYEQQETGIITDYSKANTHASQLTKSVRVPIQRKNDKYILDIFMNTPISTALISASWDGIYNQKRHVRR